MTDGSMPVRRYIEGHFELDGQQMKTPPILSKEELVEQGLVKNIKKISKLDFVDE